MNKKLLFTQGLLRMLCRNNTGLRKHIEITNQIDCDRLHLLTAFRNYPPVSSRASFEKCAMDSGGP